VTQSEVIKSIQSLLNDTSAVMQQRITDALPLGIAMFCSEYPWEWLSDYDTTTATLDATTSKYKITPPTGFFKPVVMWTDDTDELGYIDRKEWAIRQRSTGSAVSPKSYTVIGTTMFLDRAATGDTIYLVFTRDSKNITFDDVPGQYHPAVAAAVVLILVPEVMTLPDGQVVGNPAYRAAESRYSRHIQKATRLEMTHKGRPRQWGPNSAQKLRSRFRR